MIIKSVRFGEEGEGERTANRPRTKVLTAAQRESARAAHNKGKRKGNAKGNDIGELKEIRKR